MPSQISTAANDPQVPGPGRNRPNAEECRNQRRPQGRGAVCRLVPKMRPAQSSSSVTGEVLQLGFVGNIRYRRGNHILPTGPFAQVDKPAAFAAKREVLARAGHRLLANRTFQLDAWIYQAHSNCRLKRRNSVGPQTRIVRLRTHYCIPFAFPPFGCSYGFCRYRRASSSAPWVLSLVCKAWRYSLVARSRCPVMSKILPS